MSIIDKAIERNWTKKTAPVYIEQHHIVPKSIEPNNNMVCLTPREHFICHWLLVYAVNPEYKSKMSYAFFSMTARRSDQVKHYNAKGYDAARRLRSENMRGKNHPLYGKGHSEKTKKQISENKKGKPGWIPTEATKKKRSETLKKVAKRGENNRHFGKNHMKVNPQDYIILDPQGNSYKFDCLSHFCNEHKLDLSSMCKVLKGKKKHHKGFTAVCDASSLSF